VRAVIGLGANVGDRLATMRAAVGAIGAVASLRAASRVYETAPVGVTDQPDFLNAAVLVETELAPRALLDALLAIEASLGRVRRERWGPRTIDLDILWIEGVDVSEPGLAVPHPHLLERAFAVVPLLEVAPDALDPRTRGRIVAPRFAPEELLLTPYSLA
jgi:2-amino-4-hydroxy-6-hydroxymethyldihydropteridine diphosphokinase